MKILKMHRYNGTGDKRYQNAVALNWNKIHINYKYV